MGNENGKFRDVSRIIGLVRYVRYFLTPLNSHPPGDKIGGSAGLSIIDIPVATCQVRWAVRNQTRIKYHHGLVILHW